MSAAEAPGLANTDAKRSLSEPAARSRSAGRVKRLLPLADVGPDRLARRRRAPEQADLVVLDLEHEAEVEAQPLESRQDRLAAPAEHPARGEREIERVTGGLVAVDVEDLPFGAGLPGRPGLDVEHLAEPDEPEFRGEELLDGGRPPGRAGESGHGLEGEEDGDLAGADGQALPEVVRFGAARGGGSEAGVLLVDGRPAAPPRVPVHDVVVDEQARLDELAGGPGPDGGGGAGPGGGAAMSRPSATRPPRSILPFRVKASSRLRTSGPHGRRRATSPRLAARNPLRSSRSRLVALSK